MSNATGKQLRWDGAACVLVLELFDRDGMGCPSPVNQTGRNLAPDWIYRIPLSTYWKSIALWQKTKFVTGVRPQLFSEKGLMVLKPCRLNEEPNQHILPVSIRSWPNFFPSIRWFGSQTNSDELPITVQRMTEWLLRIRIPFSACRSVYSE